MEQSEGTKTVCKETVDSCMRSWLEAINTQILLEEDIKELEGSHFHLSHSLDYRQWRQKITMEFQFDLLVMDCWKRSLILEW